MRKLHRERVAKWVKALRSGKFRQARGGLVAWPEGKLPVDASEKCMPIGHCCLAVACEVYIESAGLNRVNFWSKHGSGGVLPAPVQKFFGLTNADPSVYERRTASGYVEKLSAISANDEERWRFKRIADSVEKLYLK